MKAASNQLGILIAFVLSIPVSAKDSRRNSSSSSHSVIAAALAVIGCARANALKLL